MEWVIVVVLLAGFTTLYWQGGEIMAAIDDLNAKIAELEAQGQADRASLDEMKVTIEEVRAILSGGANDQAIADAVIRLDAVLQAAKARQAELDAAEESVDPTPDV